MTYKILIAHQNYVFANLKTLMAKATPLRSGDELAGLAAENATERVAAQMALADVPLKTFLNEVLIDYDKDDAQTILNKIMVGIEQSEEFNILHDYDLELKAQKTEAELENDSKKKNMY